MKKGPAENYKIARSNLLLMIVLTLINILLVFLDSETMMLFSATIPYFMALLGYWWGMYACFVVAGIIILLYLLSWIFSKKRYGWMFVATILFVVDTIFMLALYVPDFSFDMILDILIHIWVLYYLILGIVSGRKLKKESVTGNVNDVIQEAEEVECVMEEIHSSPLRMAENTKERILLEEMVGGRRVVYRRVKRTNELVIDGYVYDEYEALVETAHVLCANIDGHIIEAGFDGKAFSYIKFDGEIVKKKMRLM